MGAGPASDPDRGHLFVVLTDTCQNGENLLVPICKIGTKYDKTCTLKAGEHEFIKYPSYVEYYRLQTYSAVVIQARVEKQIILPKSPVSEGVLNRLCEGVEKSPLSPPRQKKYYRAQQR
jgi:hypothetical protein